MRTAQVQVFQFDELTDPAKERAREWYRSCLDSSDYEFVTEDAETVLGMLGVTLQYHDVKLHGGTTRRDPNIWWQVGYMQSDGACFEGTYTYAKGAHRKIRQHAPEDSKLHDIADALLTIQRKYRYQLVVQVRQRTTGFYPEVDVDRDDYQELDHADVLAMRELIRDLCRWLYAQYRTEDEYRQSEEAVDESIRANEYEFTQDGERYI